MTLIVQPASSPDTANKNVRRRLAVMSYSGPCKSQVQVEYTLLVCPTLPTMFNPFGKYLLRTRAVLLAFRTGIGFAPEGERYEPTIPLERIRA